MEALLIINSILVAVCLYFVKDFHSEFKEVAKTVQGLKEKLSDLAGRLRAHIRTVKERFEKIDKEEQEK